MLGELATMITTKDKAKKVSFHPSSLLPPSFLPPSSFCALLTLSSVCQAPAAKKVKAAAAAATVAVRFFPLCFVLDFVDDN